MLKERPMYGQYDLPLKVEKEDFSLSLEKENGSILYRRECLGEAVTKTIFAKKGKVLLNPVEPTNKPKSITPNLLIEFESPLTIEPQANTTVFLTFPIEIGVYIVLDKKYQLIDVFSTSIQKFTLYGEPTEGIICKYWKSKVFSTIPTPDPLKEGVLELVLSNSNPTWVELKKAVFNAYEMKIFYNDQITAMKAKLKIYDDSTAETNFEESYLKKGMIKSVEVYMASKLKMMSTKFLMEHGL